MHFVDLLLIIRQCFSSTEIPALLGYLFLFIYVFFLEIVSVSVLYLMLYNADKINVICCSSIYKYIVVNVGLFYRPCLFIFNFVGKA